MTILYRKFFPGIIFVLIGMNVTIVGITAWLATSDPSVAIEPDYYRKATAWDRTADQHRDNARLGWSTTAAVMKRPDTGATVLELRLLDRAGAGVLGATVKATLFHNARASQRMEIAFTEASGGAYLAAPRCERTGVWQIQIVAQRGLETFTESIELQITEPFFSGAP